MFSMFEGLKENFILHSIHNMTFIVRRIVVVSIVCGLLGKQTAALTLLVISHALYAVYTIVLRPYKEIFVNILDFCCDGVVIIYYIVLAAFGTSYSDSKAKGLVNFIIAAQVILSFFVGVYSFVKIPIQIVKLIK